MAGIHSVLFAVHVATSLAFLAIAGLVLAVAPQRPVNRALALYYGLWGASWGLQAVVVFIPDRFYSYNASVWIYALTWSTMPIYAIFFSRALETPLVAPLRTRAGTAAMVASAVAIVVGVFAFHGSIVPPGPGHPEPEGTFLLHLILPVGLTLGFVASLDAVRRAARGSPTQRRATSYAVAFGAFDLGIGVTVAFTDFVARIPGEVRYALILASMVASLVLVTRALLRYQLFDFDLKVKWTLRRGTLVAAFVVVFLVVAEIAQIVVSNAFGIVAGLVAAALLFFAKRPIERAADRLADRAMPRVQETDEYRTVRKREVYLAAVESVIADGVVSERERAVLATLAAHLGIADPEAAAIERDALAAQSAA